MDFREFVLGLSTLIRGSLEAKVELLFKLYDTDNSGFISIVELAAIVQNGSAELSACVDFGAMALATASANEEVSDEYRHGVRFHGPVPQSDFLHALGAGERARHLVSACGDDESAARRVYDGYRRVVETADEVASAGGDRGDAMGDAFVAATLVSDDVAGGDDAVVSAALSLAEARGAPVRGCFENNKL